MTHGMPHIGITQVQRCETKSQNVGMLLAIARSKVTNHTARNERLYDGIGAFGASQTDL